MNPKRILTGITTGAVGAFYLLTGAGQAHASVDQAVLAALNPTTYTAMQQKAEVPDTTTDTDGDGISDYAELNPPEGMVVTNPNEPDSDLDGINDLMEYELDLIPTNPDCDGDLLPDGADPEPLSRAYRPTEAPTDIQAGDGTLPGAVLITWKGPDMSAITATYLNAGFTEDEIRDLVTPQYIVLRSETPDPAGAVPISGLVNPVFEGGSVGLFMDYNPPGCEEPAVGCFGAGQSIHYYFVQAVTGPREGPEEGREYSPLSEPDVGYAGPQGTVPGQPIVLGASSVPTNAGDLGLLVGALGGLALAGAAAGRRKEGYAPVRLDAKKD